MQPEDLSQGAKEILVKALEADMGNIKYIDMGESHSILIDGKKLTNSEDDKYLEALNKLIKSRLIEKRNNWKVISIS